MNNIPGMYGGQPIKKMQRTTLENTGNNTYYNIKDSGCDVFTSSKPSSQKNGLGQIGEIIINFFSSLFTPSKKKASIKDQINTPTNSHKDVESKKETNDKEKQDRLEELTSQSDFKTPIDNSEMKMEKSNANHHTPEAIDDEEMDKYNNTNFSANFEKRLTKTIENYSMDDIKNYIISSNIQAYIELNIQDAMDDDNNNNASNIDTIIKDVYNTIDNSEILKKPKNKDLKKFALTTLIKDAAIFKDNADDSVNSPAILGCFNQIFEDELNNEKLPKTYNQEEFQMQLETLKSFVKLLGNNNNNNINQDLKKQIITVVQKFANEKDAYKSNWAFNEFKDNLPQDIKDAIS